MMKIAFYTLLLVAFVSALCADRLISFGARSESYSQAKRDLYGAISMKANQEELRQAVLRVFQEEKTVDVNRGLGQRLLWVSIAASGASFLAGLRLLRKLRV